MNKEEIVAEMSKRAKVTKVDAGKVLKALMETIKSTVSKGEPVKIKGFGTFKLQSRAARTARLFNKNKVMKFPATIKPIFIPSEMFKNLVKNSKPRYFNNLWKRDYFGTNFTKSP